MQTKSRKQVSLKNRISTVADFQFIIIGQRSINKQRYRKSPESTVFN